LLALPKSIIKLPKTVLQYVMKAGKVFKQEIPERFAVVLL
jgi:hypothetical protein